MGERGKNSAERRATLILLCLAAAVATGLSLPWGLGALVFIVPGFVVAIRGLNARPGQRMPRRRAFFAVALVLLTVLSMVASVRIAFYPSQAGLERCGTTTITEAGQAECRQQHLP